MSPDLDLLDVLEVAEQSVQFALERKKLAIVQFQPRELSDVLDFVQGDRHAEMIPKP